MQVYTCQNATLLEITCRVSIHTTNRTCTFCMYLLYIFYMHLCDTHNKLRNLICKSPKQFWKILNSLQSKKENNDISMNDLYHFFKDINSTNDSHDPESENLNFSIDNDDEILNCHISENEILKCTNN